MKINCDLGEGLGIWTLGQDEAIMPYIDMANIACGFHASDPLTMQNTVTLAIENKVSIGAHPGYADLVGFGRRSMTTSQPELCALLHYQIGALQAICQAQETQVDYVKPHGALYNDMMANMTIFSNVCRAISLLPQKLPLVVQALPDTLQLESIAARFNVSLYFEAFADRQYLDSGLLVPRKDEQALLHNLDDIVNRCRILKNTGKLFSLNNQPLPLKVDTLCVHGDHPSAPLLVKALKSAFA